MNRIALSLLLLLAACGPAAEEPAANQAETNGAAAQPTEPPAAPVPSLEGQWDVTSINARPLTQAYDMGATFAGDTLTIASDCVRQGWSYTQNRNIVTFTESPIVSCDRGRTTNEDEIERVIGLANIAMFTGDDQVELSGPGGRATLTRR